MPTIVDFPTVVKAALDVFGDLFANEPERRHFAEYLTGLMMADKKTVSGINREFAVTTDQSCLNRWLNEVAWDVTVLNDRRLAWLQGDPKTRYSARGVIAIDNTLVDHAGKLIEDVGWFWDHANERYLIAHDYLISNYVCPSGAHYPIEWRRFRKRDACPEGAFTDHTALCIELIDDAVQRAIPGDFTKSAEKPRHSCRGGIGVGRAGLNAQEPNETPAVPEPSMGKGTAEVEAPAFMPGRTSRAVSLPGSERGTRQRGRDPERHPGGATGASAGLAHDHA